MSDDFGTVNYSRAERAREIDVMRQHYRRHREALQKLLADAPTEHLAAEYHRLVADIDASLVKLDELEGRASGVVPAIETPRRQTEAGMRPLVTTAPAVDEGVADDEVRRDSRSRLALIAAAAIIALAAIAWLIWKASSDRARPDAVVEQTQTQTATATTAAPATVVEEPPAQTVAGVLTVTPASHDYGTIRKGTRATRQFEIANTSDQPVSIQVARSTCRCLFYEYVELVPPKAKETVTVTIDGARAKAGALRETVKVSAKKDPAIATSFDVTANVQ